MSTENQISDAKNHFEGLMRAQLKRVERIKNQGDWTDYSKVEKVRKHKSNITQHTDRC